MTYGLHHWCDSFLFKKVHLWVQASGKFLYWKLVGFMTIRFVHSIQLLWSKRAAVFQRYS